MESDGVIEISVRNWNDRVMLDHHQAMQCWDVQDLVRFCTCTGLQLIDRFERHGIAPDHNIGFQELCRSLLRLATRVRTLSNEFSAKGFEIRDVAQLNESALRVRQLLRDLMDITSPDQSPLPPTNSSDQTGAADSWFDEDHSRLSGPFS